MAKDLIVSETLIAYEALVESNTKRIKKLTPLYPQNHALPISKVWRKKYL